MTFFFYTHKGSFSIESHGDMTSEGGEVYRLAEGGGPFFFKEDHSVWEEVDPPRGLGDLERAGNFTSTQS